MAHAFISAADSESPCRDMKGGGTERGNQKVFAAVIKMSHECTIRRKTCDAPSVPPKSPLKQREASLMSPAA